MRNRRNQGNFPTQHSRIYDRTFGMNSVQSLADHSVVAILPALPDVRQNLSSSAKPGRRDAFEGLSHG